MLRGVAKQWCNYSSTYHYPLHIGINECSTKTHDCDKNAVCKDTDVAFSCTCKPGYKGDGLKCIGKRLVTYLITTFLKVTSQTAIAWLNVSSL